MIRTVSHVAMAGRPAIFHLFVHLAWQDLLMWDNLRKPCSQILSFLSCIEAPLTSTILYYYPSPSPLLGVRRKWKLSFHFLTLFSIDPLNFDVVLKEFKVNILMLFWGKVDFIREMSANLLTASKKILCCHGIGCLRTSLVPPWYDERC